MTMPSGGIVGQAELDIRAIGQHFTSDIQQVVKPGMSQVATQGDVAAKSVGKSFGLMWRTVSNNAQGAFTPVTMALGNIENAIDTIKEKSLGLKLAGIGAAGIGVGFGLQALASGEQASQAQLQSAIENTGHAWDEYGSKIQDTVKHGEHFGVNAADTLDILATLTTASGSTSKALDRYQLVLDMAARRHISATSAAKLLGSAYAGNTRIFKMFGIDVAASTKLVKEAAAADKAAAAAADKLKTAKQNLKDDEARISAARAGHQSSAASLASAESSLASARASQAETAFKHGAASPQYSAAIARVTAAEARLAEVRQKATTSGGLTVSQQIELRKAHEAVAAAEQKVTETTKAQTDAHKAAKGAISNVNQAMDDLAQKLNGQASDAVDNFTGHLKSLKAEIEDGAAAFGAKYGPALTVASSGLMAVGSVMTVTSAIAGKFRSNTVQAAEDVTSSTGQMANQGGSHMRSLGLAVGGVTAAIGAYEAGAHVGGGAGTLTGAISGAALGLSIGGPLGAAIGGAAGGMIGLLGDLTHAAQDSGTQFDVTTASVKSFANELSRAYQLDKNKLGTQTRSQINDFLGQHPRAASAFATAGISMDEIIAQLRDPTSLHGATVQAEKAVRAGKISQQEFSQISDLLDEINGQWANQVQTADDIATINGQVTQHMRDERKSLKALLDGIYGQGPIPGSTPTSQTPHGLSGLLGAAIPKPHGHRAMGGPTFVNSSYVVGEYGPELLVMGGNNGYVHPDVRGGDGSALVAEMRALRMDVLQLVGASRQNVRATEDVAAGVGRLGKAGHSKFSSPSLATL